MLNGLNIQGFLSGLASFFLIGVFHPIVKFVEYHFGLKAWPAFVLSGAVSAILSVFQKNTFISVILGVLGFSLFWSAIEIFRQHERALKGQAERNPRREYD